GFRRGRQPLPTRRSSDLSLGYGLTKHGRVLSDFGDLSTPDGERLLTVGMTRARRSMVIVSSIRPSSFDDGRLEYGAQTLMAILGDRKSTRLNSSHVKISY